MCWVWFFSCIFFLFVCIFTFYLFIYFLNFILFLNFTKLYQFCQISKWIRHLSLSFFSYSSVFPKASPEEKDVEAFQDFLFLKNCLIIPHPLPHIHYYWEVDQWVSQLHMNLVLSYQVASAFSISFFFSPDLQQTSTIEDNVHEPARKILERHWGFSLV